jgi:hypothetical protein
MQTTMQMLRLVAPVLIWGSAVTYAIYYVATEDKKLDTPIASRPTSLRLASATESAANLATSPGDSRNASHPSPSGETARAISVRDGRLSVHADKLSLGSVLEEISAKGRISINSVGEIESVAVSANFDALPLTDGLLRLLAKFDVFFLFSAPQEEASQLKVVWVYPKGQGACWFRRRLPQHGVSVRQRSRSAPRKTPRKTPTMELPIAKPRRMN